jgi:hypothetical protein
MEMTMDARHAFGFAPQLLAALLVTSVPGHAKSPHSMPSMLRFSNPTGFAETHSTAGAIEADHDHRRQGVERRFRRAAVARHLHHLP